MIQSKKKHHRHYKRHLVLLLLFTGVLYSSPAAGRDSTDSSSTFFISADFLSYLNNLEYFNRHREGVLHLGAATSLYATYVPVPALEFSLGLYMRKAFGDEEFLSDIRPYFKGRFTKGVFTLIIGALDAENQHGMLDAVIREQYPYEQGLEEGFQMQFETPSFFADVWMSVYLLNTPKHREHLGFGLYLEKQLGLLSCIGMVYWDHYGGQLYAPENDHVRDNLHGDAGLRFSKEFDKNFEGFGTEIFVLGSNETTDRGDVPWKRGWGILSRSWVSFFRFETSFLFYKGDDFTTWQGNRMYETNDPYFQLQVKRTGSFPDERLWLDWGVRFDLIEKPLSDYFDRTEHQVWVRLNGVFCKPLF